MNWLASLIAVALSVLISQMAVAQTSTDYARMGRSAMSAFLCSAWAGIIEESDEATRLFNYAYETAQEFVTAGLDGKIERQDLSSEAPILVTMRLWGPSSEFIIGRLYEASTDFAYDELNEIDDEFPPDIATRRYRAETKFLDGNCTLLGRD